MGSGIVKVDNRALFIAVAPPRPPRAIWMDSTPAGRNLIPRS